MPSSRNGTANARFPITTFAAEILSLLALSSASSISTSPPTIFPDVMRVGISSETTASTSSFQSTVPTSSTPHSPSSQSCSGNIQICLSNGTSAAVILVVLVTIPVTALVGYVIWYRRKEGQAKKDSLRRTSTMLDSFDYQMPSGSYVSDSTSCSRRSAEHGQTRRIEMSEPHPQAIETVRIDPVANSQLADTPQAYAGITRDTM